MSADRQGSGVEPEALDLPHPRPDEIAPTADSRSEELAFELGKNLKDRRTDREIQRIIRGEKAQDHVHNMVVAGIYVVGLSALAMFVVLIWHYVTPWSFLDEGKLNNIKQILFSGTLGAALSGVAKRYLGFDDRDDN